MQNSYTLQVAPRRVAWDIMTLLPAGRFNAEDGSGPYFVVPERIIKSFDKDIPILIGDTGESAGQIQAIEEEQGAIVGHIAFHRSAIDLMLNGVASGVSVVFDYRGDGIITKIVGATLNKGGMSAAHRCDYSNPLINDALERQRKQAVGLRQSAHGKNALAEPVQGLRETGASSWNPLVSDAMRRGR